MQLGEDRQRVGMAFEQFDETEIARRNRRQGAPTRSVCPCPGNGTKGKRS